MLPVHDWPLIHDAVSIGLHVSIMCGSCGEVSSKLETWDKGAFDSLGDKVRKSVTWAHEEESLPWAYTGIA